MKMFLTIGTQAPFDRLIKAIDRWLEDNSIKVDCYAQTGNGDYEPKNMRSVAFCSEQEFNEYFSSADIVISHAGMGTIISCLSKNMPLLTLPRRLKYKEHRNDHQLATTRAFAELGYIYPIFSEADLLSELDNLSSVKCQHTINEFAEGDLISFLSRL